MKNPKLVGVSTRISEPFAKIVEEYMHQSTNVSPADLLRDALREKIRRDSPTWWMVLRSR